jgi:organic radical activating enzyme
MSVEGLMEDIKTSQVGAVTITGGEPLDQYTEMLWLLKILFPKFSHREMNQVLSGTPAGRYHIMLTSGYTLAVIKKKFPAILDHVDILIDGPFKPELRDKDSTWRGSTNQGINFLTEWARKFIQPGVSAEIRIGTDGNALITGFGIPASIVPETKRPSRYEIARD